MIHPRDPGPITSASLKDKAGTELKVHVSTCVSVLSDSPTLFVALSPKTIELLLLKMEICKKKMDAQ